MNKGIIVNTLGVIVRGEPDKFAKVVGALNAFDSVEIINEGEMWTEIRANNMTGYIPTFTIFKEVCR